MISEFNVESPHSHFKIMKNGTIPFDLIIKNKLNKYECHAIVLSASSKKIYGIISADNSIKKITFDYPDEFDCLSQIINFCYGFDYTITSHNCDITYLISTDLDIPELHQPALECLEKSFTITSLVPSLIFIYQANGNINPHLHFIRKHFSEMMYNDNFMMLPFQILDEILASKELNVSDENAIAMWVAKVIRERGEECAKLVDRLYLAELSDQSLLELCAREEIESHILLEKAKKAKLVPDKEKRIYTLPKQDIEKLIVSDNQVTIDMPSEKSIKGIINYIIKHQEIGKSEIRVEVSSAHYKYFLPQNLLKLEDEHTVWYSSEQPNQWVLYDFTPRVVKVTGYTLRTSGGNKGQGHLRSWNVSGSNDRQKWIQIDERRDVDELNSNYASISFKCKCPDYFRFIKITQIDINHHNDYSFILSCCEFFGQFVPKEIK